MNVYSAVLECAFEMNVYSAVLVCSSINSNQFKLLGIVVQVFNILPDFLSTYSIIE